MDMMEQLSRIGIVPVIAINDAADAVPLAQALIDGGLPCAEVTFRTAAAADAIKNMTEAFPDMVVGAGTVLTCEQVDRAVAAGAKFIVSPGLNPTTVKHCQEIGIPGCPGTANPSDIEVALSLGLKTVKFFPAEAAGGLKYIKSIAAPYVDMKFMPTGGVNEKNLLDYLSFNKIICCGGSWKVPGDDVKASDASANDIIGVTLAGWMNGTGTGFSPNASLDRAMMVTILYRLAGSPAVSGTMPFTDVAAGSWYYNAVLWASQKDITLGTSAATFSPNALLTPDQLGTLLQRFTGKEAQGLPTGQTNVTRAQAAAVLLASVTK